VKIPCKYCKNTFEPKGKASKFCSLSCAAKFNGEQRRPSIKCALCHARAGVRPIQSSRLLNVDKGSISEIRKRHGVRDLNKWVVIPAKRSNPYLFLNEAFRSEQKAWVNAARTSEWTYKQSREEVLHRMRERYHANREYFREYQNRIYSTPEQKEKRYAANKEWRKRNADKVSELAKKYKSKNPDKFREYARKQRSKPIMRIRKSLSKRLRDLVGKVNGKSRSVGCTSLFLKEHIQSQFKDGMTWSNYGIDWHIDHIKPLASFDLFDPTQRDIANNWSNLRPMFANENMAKGDKLMSHYELGGNLFGWVALS